MSGNSTPSSTYTMPTTSPPTPTSASAVQPSNPGIANPQVELGLGLGLGSGLDGMMASTSSSASAGPSKSNQIIDNQTSTPKPLPHQTTSTSNPNPNLPSKPNPKPRSSTATNLLESFSNKGQSLNPKQTKKLTSNEWEVERRRIERTVPSTFFEGFKFPDEVEVEEDERLVRGRERLGEKGKGKAKGKAKMGGSNPFNRIIKPSYPDPNPNQTPTKPTSTNTNPIHHHHNNNNIPLPVQNRISHHTHQHNPHPLLNPPKLGWLRPNFTLVCTEGGIGVGSSTGLAGNGWITEKEVEESGGAVELGCFGIPIGGYGYGYSKNTHDNSNNTNNSKNTNSSNDILPNPNFWQIITQHGSFPANEQEMLDWEREWEERQVARSGIGAGAGGRGRSAFGGKLTRKGKDKDIGSKLDMSIGLGVGGSTMKLDKSTTTTTTATTGVGLNVMQSSNPSSRSQSTTPKPIPSINPNPSSSTIPSQTSLASNPNPNPRPKQKTKRSSQQNTLGFSSVKSTSNIIPGKDKGKGKAKEVFVAVTGTGTDVAAEGEDNSRSRYFVKPNNSGSKTGLKKVIDTITGTEVIASGSGIGVSRDQVALKIKKSNVVGIGTSSTSVGPVAMEVDSIPRGQSAILPPQQNQPGPGSTPDFSFFDNTPIVKPFHSSPSLANPNSNPRSRSTPRPKPRKEDPGYESDVDMDDEPNLPRTSPDLGTPPELYSLSRKSSGRVREDPMDFNGEHGQEGGEREEGDDDTGIEDTRQEELDEQEEGQGQGQQSSPLSSPLPPALPSSSAPQAYPHAQMKSNTTVDGTMIDPFAVGVDSAQGQGIVEEASDNPFPPSFQNIIRASTPTNLLPPSRFSKQLNNKSNPGSSSPLTITPTSTSGMAVGIGTEIMYPKAGISSDHSGVGVREGNPSTVQQQPKQKKRKAFGSIGNPEEKTKKSKTTSTSNQNQNALSSGGGGGGRGLIMTTSTEFPTIKPRSKANTESKSEPSSSSAPLGPGQASERSVPEVTDVDMVTAEDIEDESGGWAGEPLVGYRGVQGDQQLQAQDRVQQSVVGERSKAVEVRRVSTDTTSNTNTNINSSRKLGPIGSFGSTSDKASGSRRFYIGTPLSRAESSFSMLEGTPQPGEEGEGEGDGMIDTTARILTMDVGGLAAGTW